MSITPIKFVEVRSKDSGTTRQLLSPSDYKEGNTVADLIRLCVKKEPTASNGEISRFLTAFTGKTIRPQWVYNVKHQELKRK